MKEAYGALSREYAKSPKKESTPKHGIKHTHIEHHNDGSHTIRHTMHTGPETSHTAPDLDALHDHLEEHMGEPNQGEAEAMQQAGVAPPQAAAAGIPQTQVA